VYGVNLTLYSTQGLSADSRAQVYGSLQNELLPLLIQKVKYVDDTGLAYVMQRYREVHDLVHAVNGMGIGYANLACSIQTVLAF